MTEKLNKNQVQLLTDMALTGNQYVFLVCVYHNDAALLSEHKTAIAPLPLIMSDEIKDLQRRKFIEKGEVGWKAGPALVDMLGEKDVYEMYNEFFNTYPSFTKIEGRNVPLKIVDQKKMGIIYGDLISRENHADIMADLEYAIDNNLINMKIDKYITSGYHTTIRTLRLEQPVTNVGKDF
jgi:hypothetical protein